MASRRTRIKGIANIPQRRKNVVQANVEDNEVKITPEGNSSPLEEEQEKKDKSIDNIKETSSNNKQDLLNNNESNEDQCNIEPINKDKQTDAAAGSIGNKAINNVKDKNNVPNNKDEMKEEKILEKPKDVAPRRRFIKPAVAVNAITRKIKESNKDDNSSGSSSQNNLNTSKVVILNETLVAPANNSTEEKSIPPVNMEHTMIRPLPVVTLTSDVEYPLPAPSPTKINRTRIKAIPRFNQRHTSFSASESEDESKRNNRIRTESVCSTTSTIVESVIMDNPSSPQKVPKEYNITIQRKCRRTEQSRKLAEARRDFFYKFGNNKPDRQKLTMMDLIFYNPQNNLMSHNKKKTEETNNEAADNHNDNGNDNNNKEENGDKPGGTPAESDEENAVPAPQIKVGPNGELIVDEKSLVIENTSIKKSREQIKNSKIINGDYDTGYGIYKRRKRAKDWNKQETLKFYKALNTIGTDFTMMCELFPRRTRRELKMKFKKEERVNRHLVDKALTAPCSFDFNEFKDEVDLEEMELKQQKNEDLQQNNKTGKTGKKRGASQQPKNEPKTSQHKRSSKKKRKLEYNILDLDDDDTEDEADESDVNSSDENDDVTVLHSLQKPTRSGRIPKLLDRYQPPQQEHPAHMIASKPKPGVLTSMVSQSDDGETVLKVFMVTPEHGKQATFGDGIISNLTKTMENNIFTISVNKTETSNDNNHDDDDDLENNENQQVEENNITICHDNDNNDNGDAVIKQGDI